MSYLDDDSRSVSAGFLVLLVALGLLVGGLGTFFVNHVQFNALNAEVEDLQEQVVALQGAQSQTVTNQTITIYQNATDLSELHAKVYESIVIVRGLNETSGVQGSGFVYNYSGNMYVITNYHVIDDASELSVTFSNGRGYAATHTGSDPYADLAVLTVDAPDEEFHPIPIVSSSSLRVGDQVIAIGNPYGLVGSLTTGIVSALGRSMQEDTTARYSIANIIQTSTPINPGNSGGPLLNAVGEVVGVTTAILYESQGLGFAVPSDTILRELPSLIATGRYDLHSYLGVFGNGMNYQLAKEQGINVTYGWLVNSTTDGGPSDGILQGGDVITALNATTIKNNDDLASYLESKTLPGDVVIVTVVRDNVNVDLQVTLGTRPPPT
ncbi:MAG: trypsin-like peptidase domain-containing protein [Candidatus Bathyarchaeota archaeon]|nr:trypsin-like peptidase domain-containing protein [Candidatus Bathyarchaeota archaeon]